VQVRAVNTRYAFANIPETPVTIQIGEGPGGQAHAMIESPAAGAEVSGLTVIRGYAYVEGLRVLNLDLLIDGVTYGSPLLLQRRNDVCNGLANVPDCPFAGFTLNLNTAATSVVLPNGPHSMQIRVLDETGRLSVFPEGGVAFTVNNPVVAGQVAALTSPKNNDTLSGVVHIGGYAYDAGSQITAVTLLVDGESRGAIPFGTPRVTECEQLPDVKACTNIGFDLDFDTRVMGNGPHVLGVRVTSKSGQSSIIPGPAGGLSPGINVTVRN
jgi:hypothetical protein